MKPFYYYFTISLLLGISFSLQAAPFPIDDFSTDLAPTMTATTVDGPMLGGEADLDFGATGTLEISGGVCELSGVPASGTIQIIYDGDDDNAGVIAFALPDVDLTDGGKNDRFEVDLTSVTGSIDVTVWVYDDVSNGKYLTLPGVTGPGVLIFPFADLIEEGAGADLSAVKAVGLEIVVDGGEGFAVSSFRTNAAPPSKDTIPPTVTLLKKKKLKSPRPRHSIKGTVPGDVVKVEVKSRLKKGWRKVKLSSSGKWKFRTPRLKSGKNRFQVRATDAGGNVSRAIKITVRGVSGLDLGSGR